MGRFLFWTILFIMAGGLILHYKIDLPFISTWLGRLPGDLIVKKGRVLFYFPITSAVLASIIVSLMVGLFAKKK